MAEDLSILLLAIIMHVENNNIIYTCSLKMPQREKGDLKKCQVSGGCNFVLGVLRCLRGDLSGGGFQGGYWRTQIYQFIKTNGSNQYLK